MTHKVANGLTKAVWINSWFRFTQTSRRRVQDPNKSQEELYKEYIMQAKTALHKSKVHRRKKEVLPAFICFVHREGRWLLSSAHPLRNNPVSDLIFTWSDFITKIKYKSFFSVGFFFQPSGVWKFLLVV